MATALQCPSCGHKHRLDGPRSESSFACSSCGQTLKVPAQFIAAPKAPVASSVGAAAPVSMRPVIGHNQRPTGPAVDADLDHGLHLDGDDDIDDQYLDDDGFIDETAGGYSDPHIGAKVRLTRQQRRAVMATSLPWWGRLLSWLVALPLAGLIVLVPMRITRFFSGSYLLGLVAETGFARYGRLLVAIICVALVAALIVQAIAWFVKRRRVKKLQEAAGANVDLAISEAL